MTRRRNPYDVLDLSPLATYEEARAAYRRLAAIFHPDRFLDVRADVRLEAEKQMRYVNEAWNDLQERLRTMDQDDREERERQARRLVDDPVPTTVAGAGHDEFAPRDDFSSRARHARTKQRTWQKSNAATEAKERAQQQAEDARRAQFVEDAKERLAAEEAERAARETDDVTTG
jgi:curved DNA-binding protein CbpA